MYVRFTAKTILSTVQTNTKCGLVSKLGRKLRCPILDVQKQVKQQHKNGK